MLICTFVALIVLATAFSMVRYIIVKAHVYTKKTQVTCEIFHSIPQKCCLTSMTFVHVGLSKSFTV